MSGKSENTSLTGFVISLIGCLIMVLGVLLVYFSFNTTPGIVSPYSITPIGFFIALIGAFMILAKKT
ncbi:hypothetical protein KEJ21_02885 [Candidatus Bathyarchaeota archaeon]|nr:hypothetical protein [Candidatus Bathyarchaeota archaeon]MBS7630990.1 hypothetical protein [Candidatus Bathyarchaeota archaeon]